MKNLLHSGNCHVCNSKYVDLAIGNSHIYATCPKCERRDEIGLVFQK